MKKVGTCGWSFIPLKPKEEKVKTKLQAYVKYFPVVEINSTFYRIPKISTVKKWREEVDEISQDFEFVLKVFKEITHMKRFGEKSIKIFNSLKEIAKILRTKVLLFQCPESFTPSRENLNKMKIFFQKVEREDFIFVVEVRWQDKWRKEVVVPVFQELKLNQCVDPFRQSPFYIKEVLYYRLHGLGKRMYDYKFNDRELYRLHKMIDDKTLTYIFFNNYSAFQDAKRFVEISHKSG